MVCTLLFEHLFGSEIKENCVLKTDHYKTAIYSDRMEMDTDILNWAQKISEQHSHCSQNLCLYLSADL